MADALRPTPQATALPARRTWSLPILRELPKLTDLTLASAIGGGGGTTGGGSTVFGLLLAAGLLVSGCSADRTMEPREAGEPAMPKAMASITCTGDVTTRKFECAGPISSPGREILGGQGTRVVLRAALVQFTEDFLGSVDGNFDFQVTIQNVSAQKLGQGGPPVPTGIYAFFEAEPVPDVGSATIMNWSGIDGFTAGGGQKYYWYNQALDPQQTSATLPWRIRLTGGATSFTFNVLVAADVFDNGGVLRWESVAGYDKRKYNDVAASSPTDRMAVGRNGLTARWNGVQWTTIPAIIDEDIRTVTGAGPGKYFAATSNGRILHYDGKAWTVVYDRGDASADFYDIWANSDTLAVAVGAGGRVSRLSPITHAWSNADIATAGGGPLVAVDGSSNGNKITTINGASGSTQVFTSTGGVAFGINNTFFGFVGAWGSAIASDIVYDADGTLTVVYEQGGVTWIVNSTVGIVLNEAGQTPRALVAVGLHKVAFGFGKGGVDSIILIDYDVGIAYTAISDGLGFSFDGMTATDAGGTTFQVTVPADQQLYEWNGTFWAATQGGAVLSDPDLWGSGNTVWMVVGSGGFQKIVGGVVTPLTGHPGLHDIWGTSTTSFVGVTDDDIVAGDGVAAFTTLYNNPGFGYKDVWAGTPGGTIIALMSVPSFTQRYLGAWTNVNIGETLSAVWGCSDSEAWITTEVGHVYHWVNGVATPDMSLPPFPTVLRAVRGTSCSDVWVVGDNGFAYHWNGAGWSFNLAASSVSPRAVVVRGTGQAITGGYSGQGGIYTEFDPTYFRQVDVPTQGMDITSMWRTDNGQLYVAGPGLLMRGLR